MASPDLAIETGKLLLEQEFTIAAAESCTGGLLMHHLTNIAGSSAYVAGGVVAYSNRIKHSMLSVQENTLNVFGAVSEQVAAAMARGVRAVMGAQIGVSITGIAGPDGGTPEKPVGLTFIAIDSPDVNIVRRFVWEHDRIGNKEASAEAALRMVIDFLKQNYT